MTQTVILYPSWFGGRTEAIKAAHEQANYAAKLMKRIVKSLQIKVDPNDSQRWLVTATYSGPT